MARRNCSILLWLFLGTAVASGEELTGYVFVSGSAVNIKVHLTEKDQSTGPSLCKNETANKVKKLLRLEVSVSGDWRKDKSGSPECFEGSTFKVLRHPNGRESIVGVLAQDGANYLVKSSDGKTSNLSEIPSGLMKLKGKKVILDLKPMDSPGQKGSSFKVVTYTEFPE